MDFNKKINIQILSRKISKLLIKSRKKHKYSLRIASDEFKAFVGGLTLSASTIYNYEQKGVPKDVIKFLLLLNFYSIKLDSIFNHQYQILAESDFSELLRNDQFRKFCRLLIRQNYRTRNGILIALNKFETIFEIEGR